MFKAVARNQIGSLLLSGVTFLTKLTSNSVAITQPYLTYFTPKPNPKKHPQPSQLQRLDGLTEGLFPCLGAHALPSHQLPHALDPREAGADEAVTRSQERSQWQWGGAL